MEIAARWAVLAGATAIAAAAAFGMAWALLSGALHLIEPAAGRLARQKQHRLERDSQLLARGYTRS